ncbi:DUF3515 family protein [Streptomyces sp. NPDC006512]|uniref:DUF3515 family protein n=1 Tax=Streptomyces sp. NPDC006512 TaxID=3154307 RepID=UPI0033A5FDEB
MTRTWTGAVCAVAVAAAVGGLVTALDDYAVPAGPFARSAACTDVVGRLPERLLGRDRDAVEGAGAAGWGGGAVILRCGVRPPAPTVDTCMNVNGVDWVLDDERAKRGDGWVFTVYGTDPAVEVSFKESRQLAGDALVAVGGSLGGLVRKSRCLALSDT